MEVVIKELKWKYILFCWLNTGRKLWYICLIKSNMIFERKKFLVVWFKTSKPRKFKVNTNIVVMKDYRIHCFHNIMGEFPKRQLLLLPPGWQLKESCQQQPAHHSPLPHPDLPSESLDDMKDDIPNTRNDTIKLMSLNKIKTYVVEYASE